MAATITPTELFRELTTGGVPEILDIRNKDEFAMSRVEAVRPVRTRNVPVYEVFEDLDAQAAATESGAVVVCGQGNASELLVEEFADRGVAVRSLEGGTEAWAKLLVPVEVPDLPGDLRAWQLQRPAKACLSYLVGVPGGRAAVFDPTRHPQAYLDLAGAHGMRIVHVVDTHVHADHISGGPALAQQLGAEYHLPPEDAGGVVPWPHRSLRDGEELDLGSATVRTMTMHLPGHTPGTTAFLVAERMLIVGDTVFVRGLGRPDLTGQAEELARDLFRSVHERLEPLDPATLIAPAHWSSNEEFDADGLVMTTLEDVFRATLLNERAMERFVEQIVSSLPQAPASYDTIRAVNAGLLAPPPDELDVLDVGRNLCAASTTLP